MNLKNYILRLDSYIPLNICKKTINELSYFDWERHKWSNSKDFKLASHYGNKELDVCGAYNITFSNERHNLTWKAIEKYILIDKVGGDNLVGWNGFSPIRFNRYNKNQIMSKHVDHIHSLFTGDKRGIPILSIVCVLNEDYEGGEFIMFDDFEIKFKSGDLIIFPSVFLYPHLVKPIKKGTRYSFVSWCY